KRPKAPIRGCGHSNLEQPPAEVGPPHVARSIGMHIRLEPEGALEAALSEYIVGPRADQVPTEVRERARLHILDTLGAMLSGRSLKPGQLALAMARAQGGTPEASVVGSELRTSAVQAALANGMAAHADE